MFARAGESPAPPKLPKLSHRIQVVGSRVVVEQAIRQALSVAGGPPHDDESPLRLRLVARSRSGETCLGKAGEQDYNRTGRIINRRVRRVSYGPFWEVEYV